MELDAGGDRHQRHGHPGGISPWTSGATATSTLLIDQQGTVRRQRDGPRARQRRHRRGGATALSRSCSSRPAGVTDGDILSSGGWEEIYDSATASGLTISGGGFVQVNSGGLLAGGFIDAAGSAEMLNGGAISGLTVNSGGVLDVGPGLGHGRGPSPASPSAAAAMIDYPGIISAGQTLSAGRASRHRGHWRRPPC